jgi:hypothetical protein
MMATPRLPKEVSDSEHSAQALPRVSEEVLSYVAGAPPLVVGGKHRGPARSGQCGDVPRHEQRTSLGIRGGDTVVPGTTLVFHPGHTAWEPAHPLVVHIPLLVSSFRTRGLAA